MQQISTISRLKHMAQHQRPQERMEELGAAGLSDIELLAMILRKGTHKADVIDISHQLVLDAGSLAGLLEYDVSDFRHFEGIGKVKALQLAAVLEVSRRILHQGETLRPVLDLPEKVFRFIQPVTLGLTVEKFWVLCLNRKNRLIRMKEVTSGIATASLVHPREVFREAVRLGATALICAHNHPSGDPTPSAADIQVTRQLKQASSTLQIDLLDHIVIGHPEHDPQARGYYSFSETGML